jgi:hypothetical protein
MIKIHALGWGDASSFAPALVCKIVHYMHCQVPD